MVSCRGIGLDRSVVSREGGEVEALLKNRVGTEQCSIEYLCTIVIK